jgi:N-acetyl-anhydromuramyl-L-alanine amidase AmpD
MHGHGNAIEKPKVDKYIPTTQKSSREGAAIKQIIVHYTTSHSIQGAIDTFLHERVDPATGRTIRTSAHYIVDRDGSLIQMVDDSDAAWHAVNS